MMYIVTRSIWFTNEYIHSKGFHVKDVNVPGSNLGAASTFELGNENFKKGWVRRNFFVGWLYWRKFIKDYKDDMGVYFERGIVEKSGKMNSDQIREALKYKYPNRFTIPSET